MNREKKYYFTRHGQSQANVDEIFAGDSESPLTAKGVYDAQAEGRRLAQEGATYDLIISSPLSRAIDTAAILARSIGYLEEDIVIEKLLLERSFGDLAGKPWSSVSDETSPAIVEMGGESIEELSLRVKRGLNKIVELSKGKVSVLVVGHGTWYQMAEALIEGRDEHTFLESANLPNNTVIELRL